LKIIKGLIILFAVSISAIFFMQHGRNAYTFYGDACGYYSYLPSAFIYHNFHQLDSLPTDKHIDEPILAYFPQRKAEGQLSEKGFFINQYTFGTALMELPFFLMAHFLAKPLGFYNNGYDTIYHYFIKFGNLLYAFLGLFVLFKVLKKIVSEPIALLTVCLLLLASNLFWFALLQAGMAHIPLFFLVSLLLYYTIHLHERVTWYRMFIVAFLCGLITIIRPSDIIFCLLPILYGIHNIDSLIDKFKLIKNNFFKLVASSVFFLLPILPQLLLWKKYAGHYKYYSYGANVFNWAKPQIIKGLFSFSNGWLAYSPVFFLAFAGLFFASTFKKIFLPIIIILPIYIYVIYSWTCWNYVNGFGSRPMIHAYPLLAMPLAIFIQYIYQKNTVIKIVSSILLLILIAYNVKLSWQNADGQLFSENANYTFVKQTILKNDINAKDLIALDCEQQQPVESKLMYIDTIGTWQKTDTGKDYYTIPKIEFTEPLIQNSVKKLNKQKQQWIKCCGEFCATEATDIYLNQLMVLELLGNEKVKVWKAVKINNKLGLNNGKHIGEHISIGHGYWDEWDKVEMYIPISAEIESSNKWKCSIWNLPKHELKIKNFRLELWEEKE
jgi:hypothetical protein